MTLYYKAINLAKLQSPDATEAFCDYLTFVRNSPEAKQLLEKDPEPSEHCIRVAQTHINQGNQYQFLEEISKNIEHGKALYDKDKFQEALDLLIELRQRVLCLDGITNINHDIELLFWISKCYCAIGDHENAMDRREYALELLQNRFKKNVKITIGDIYEDEADCLHQHVRYFQEALKVTKLAIKHTNNKVA